MRVAVTATGEGKDSEVSNVFGRCPYFVIMEVSGEGISFVKAVKNPAIDQRGGAGIAAAELIVNEKVDAVISGAIGPRASSVLNQFGVEMYAAVSGNVEENVQKLAAGELSKIIE
ncbi:MAG: NifB/NifX family molybdenum-iron cluster-binding protein [Candidatus Diapherotrites archaeon]|nr:NifB/NifX family molybdenum-iron cluster-binding protein [Candidatus Diapherotrites archaeon]